MSGFAGQDPSITVGGFVEKVTKKFIEISKTKSDRMKQYIQAHSKNDGMSPSDQQQVTDQGMQDAADNIALAIYAALKETNGVIISNQANDPDFWAYMTNLSASVTSIKAAFDALQLTLCALPMDGAAYAAASAATVVPAIQAIVPPPSATQLKAHMEK
jgi:hypothetical protein